MYKSISGTKLVTCIICCMRMLWGARQDGMRAGAKTVQLQKEGFTYIEKLTIKN